MKIVGLFSVFGFSNASDIPGDIPDDVCVKNGAIVSCMQPRGAAGLDSSPSSDIDEREDRRYADLAEMSKKHWRKNDLGREWDERKFWGYGCHCFMVGDRPLSDMGFGIPVDDLDSACRQWKDCQMCVRKNHGEQCIGEFKKYTWKYKSKLSDFAILNGAGTCEREIGECDLKFVKDTFNNRNEYDEQYNYFYGGFDKNDRDENCPPSYGPPVVHECCGGYESPWYWIGLNKNQCCIDPNNPQEQHVAPAGTTCNF